MGESYTFLAWYIFRKVMLNSKCMLINIRGITQMCISNFILLKPGKARILKCVVHNISCFKNRFFKSKVVNVFVSIW